MRKEVSPRKGREGNRSDSKCRLGMKECRKGSREGQRWFMRWGKGKREAENNSSLSQLSPLPIYSMLSPFSTSLLSLLPPSLHFMFSRLSPSPPFLISLSPFLSRSLFFLHDFLSSAFHSAPGASSSSPRLLRLFLTHWATSSLEDTLHTAQQTLKERNKWRTTQTKIITTYSAAKRCRITAPAKHIYIYVYIHLYISYLMLMKLFSIYICIL